VAADALVVVVVVLVGAAAAAAAAVVVVEVLVDDWRSLPGIITESWTSVDVREC